MQDFNDKINQIYKDIFSETKRQLDSLLSLCESPIEKLFLINIFNHYYKLSLTHVKIEFIFRPFTMYEESEDATINGQYVEDMLTILLKHQLFCKAYE